MVLRKNSPWYILIYRHLKVLVSIDILVFKTKIYAFETEGFLIILLFWLSKCPFLFFSYFWTMIWASLSWRHLKVLHLESAIKGTSAGTYAWHQGTPNGPIKSSAVFVIHKLSVPKKCQMAPCAELPAELCCPNGAHKSWRRCVWDTHRRASVTTAEQRPLSRLKTMRGHAFFRRGGEARGERSPQHLPLLESVFPTRPPRK